MVKSGISYYKSNTITMTKKKNLNIKNTNSVLVPFSCFLGGFPPVSHIQDLQRRVSTMGRAKLKEGEKKGGEPRKREHFECLEYGIFTGILPSSVSNNMNYFNC